ncbi:FecR domain-containing protein [Allorhodopirellula heiligendammensis]|uniref:FecR protein n=1 Tax=Allorhodopirellula heiligendammensis TaxID=2714739 RepID=A0A5C6C4Z7_9BACT|nr:FecR domain-containing protein [Allorhodopirellula heiligendammensis]TWU19258.1 FecR protein [Allorhodopirellula heiligendammensis]
MNDSERDAFLESIAAFQNGGLSESQLVQFESDLLGDIERQRLFVEVQCRSGEIAECCRAAAFTFADSPTMFPAREVSTSRFNTVCGAVVAIAIAAVVAFAMLNPVVRQLPEGDIPSRLVTGATAAREDVFATVTYANHAVLSDSGSAAIDVGAEIVPNVQYRLTSGALRLCVRGGAIVSLAAPASFRGTGRGEIELESGKLAARLPNDEADLVVRSGGTVMRDLGTAFGVTARSNGEVDLSVFDGMVSVEHVRGPANAQRQTVTEGESIVTTRDAVGSRGVAYAAAQYHDIWPLTVGIDDASSLIEFVKPGPIKSIEQLASDDKLLLFPEKLNRRLDEDQFLMLQRPGSSWPASQGERTHLARTRSISSYLLVYFPKDRVNVQRHSISGSISFQRPIIGVAVKANALAKSDKLFGIAEIDYQSLEMRYLEPETTEEGLLPADSLQISKDGRHLYFNLYVGAGQDNIRVLVDEDAG